nr:MAG TPA: hypothetical protein [Caudoviricetes sp.]
MNKYVPSVKQNLKFLCLQKDWTVNPISYRRNVAVKLKLQS